ncbi:MAG: hypothetical protein NT157_03950 [Candidatus Micrarchaeota archaeon]|nr:hypothetical protein [Candidatus Micrarchaeota archaeon]
MDFQQTIVIISLVKVLLACLAVLFLFGFFMRWKFFRHRLPSLAFYTKRMFIRHNIVLGTGMIMLSLAFIVDFIAPEAGGGAENMGLMASVLEVFALVAISYSYYKLVRLEVPG